MSLQAGARPIGEEIGGGIREPVEVVNEPEG